MDLPAAYLDLLKRSLTDLLGSPATRPETSVAPLRPTAVAPPW
jgi:hypothetical protein